MSVEEKLLDQKEDQTEEEKEEDSEKTTDGGSNGSDDGSESGSEDSEDGEEVTYKTGSESSDDDNSDTPKAPTELPPKIKKSSMEALNDKTRKKQMETKPESLEGLKILHSVFKDYKIGDEEDFLKYDKSFLEKAKAKLGPSKKSSDKPPDVSDKKSNDQADSASMDTNAPDESSDSLDDNLEDQGENPVEAASSLENDLSEFSNGDGIAGGAIEAIHSTQRAFGSDDKESSEDENETSEDETSDDEAEESNDDKIKEATKLEKLMDVFYDHGDTALSAIALIPGFSIVVSGIRVLMDTYEAIQSNRQRVKMNNYRRLFKEKYLNKSYDFAKEEETDENDKNQSTKNKSESKSMVTKASVFKFWKKTDLTVDQKTMKTRLDELIALESKDALSGELKEEVQDIQKFIIEDKLRKINRNKRIIKTGTLILNLMPFAGSLTKYIGSVKGKVLSPVTGTNSQSKDQKKTGLMTGMKFGIKKLMENKPKAKEYTKHLIHIIATLPDSYDSMSDKFKYVETKDIVDATGIRSKKLLRIANYVKEVSKDENKKRGKAKAFNMFVSKFK